MRLDGERVHLSPDEALALLVDGEYVHVQSNPCAGMFIGADWSRDDVLESFKEASEVGVLELAGELATEMGHGVAALLPGRRLFFATDPAKLAAFDPSAVLSKDTEDTGGEG